MKKDLQGAGSDALDLIEDVGEFIEEPFKALGRKIFPKRKDTGQTKTTLKNKRKNPFIKSNKRGNLFKLTTKRK